MQMANKNTNYLKARTHDILAEEGEPIEDWMYLVHHVNADPNTGKEILRHCFLLDHLGNKYAMAHIAGKDGKYYHAIVGLHPENDIVFWSDEEAEAHGEKVPAANRQMESQSH